MSLFRSLFAAALLTGMAIPGAALADSVANSTTGIGGYDLVSYHQGEKPLRGNGNHLAVHDGVTYLFINKTNRRAFEKNPDKYLPAYGGYCAFGVSVGKKFVGDPDVWELVDGQLYLNLDNKIKGMWVQDIPGNIKKADKRWPGIRNTAAADL